MRHYKRCVLLLYSGTPAVSSIPVPLNQVSGSRARARANRRALLAANQSAADPARDAADDGPFGSAVVMPSRPPLNGRARGHERTEQQRHTQEQYDYAFSSA
jgi:hypothetical protein